MWVGLVRSKIIFTYAVLPFARVYGYGSGVFADLDRRCSPQAGTLNPPGRPPGAPTLGISYE